MRGLEPKGAFGGLNNQETTLVDRDEQSVAARWREAETELGTAFGRGLIERDIRPRLIIDASARLLWASSSADRLLRAPFPVYLRNRRLCFEDGQASQDGEAFLGSLDNEQRRLFVINREDDCWVLINGWAEKAEDQRLLFLSFSLSQPVIDSVSSGLAGNFGLTRAEAVVLDEFARLRSSTQIAQRLGITVNTVRSHLKRIHAKTSVNSNVRLLQIVRAFGDS